MALLAVGIAAAVYVGGIARIIDQDTQRFDGGAFPAESGRPGSAGASDRSVGVSLSTGSSAT